MLNQLGLIWKYRYFWLSLVQMDLKRRYRRTVLGIGWSLITPMLMTVVYCFVFGALFSNPDWRVYGPYFLAGMSLFNFVRDSVAAGCQTFFRNENFIRQSPLPLTIYTLRTVLGEGIHFLISQAIVIAAICALLPDMRWPLLFHLWFIIPSIGLLFVFCWSISVLSSFVSVYFLDSSNLTDVTFQMVFFLTPIVYPVSMIADRGLSILLSLNPIVSYLEVIRTPMLTGEIPPLWAFEKALIVAALFASLAIAAMAWLEKRLIFRL
jgi:lipopolysaccharide transport system permease protein